jgi:hypothetical protein
MLRRPALSLVLAATLLLALAAPSGAAGTRGASHPPDSFWRAAWEWIVSLVPVPTTDAGCDIDPNGRCRP